MVENDFLKIVQKSADAMLVLDLNGVIQYVNPAGIELFNMPGDEMIGKMLGFPLILREPVDLYVLRGFREFVAVEMRMVEVEWKSEPSYLISLRDMTWRVKYEEELRRSRDELEARVEARTSELLESNANLQQEIESRKVAVEELRVEAEERRVAEEALRESEELFRTMADNIPNLAWIANKDGGIFWYNKQWYDYTGSTLEEMQGWGWQNVHHPDYVKAVTEEWRAHIKAGRPYYNISPLRGKDGNYRWFLTRITPIPDTEGNILRWFGTNTDITERKQAEDELKEAKEQAEMYLDLMAHDISNLNQIGIGYMELMAESSDLDEIKELLKKPQEAMISTSQLIENVKKLKDITTGEKKKESLKPVNLCDILSAMKRQYIGANDRDITINLDMPSVCFVTANDLVSEVFTNLLGNALKHSNPDEPLTININVKLIKEKQESYYRFMVEDNGPGIPDYLKDKIFARFQRGRTKSHGKGLGLYLVKALVEGYHGKAWVEDRVTGDHSKGARFVIVLPSAEQ